MIHGRKIIVTFLVAFAMAGGVSADMMPMLVADPSSEPSAQRCPAADPGPDAGFYAFFTSETAHSGLLPFATFSRLHLGTESKGSTEPVVQVLAQDRSSLDLCLYGLVGLGLCRSGRWAKKSALGLVPDWYHCGGPHQIGSSRAISPETLCPVPLCCFIQPGGAQGDSLSPRRREAITPRRRPSQHTPTSIGSRDPPFSA